MRWSEAVLAALGLLILVGAGLMMVQMVPEGVRYLKIEKM
jgi:hypothetical protein